MADENLTTGLEDGGLSPAALGALLASVAKANEEESYAALGARVIDFMRNLNRNEPKETPIAHYPDLGEILTPGDLYEAVSRRIMQARGMCALFGHAHKMAGAVEDLAFEYAAWGAKDLLTQADALALQLLRMVPEEGKAA